MENDKEAIIQAHRAAREKFADLVESMGAVDEAVKLLEAKMASNPKMYGMPLWRLQSQQLSESQLENRTKLYEEVVEKLEKEGLIEKIEIKKFIASQPNPNISVAEEEVSVETQAIYDYFIAKLEDLSDQQYNLMLDEFEDHRSFYGDFTLTKKIDKIIPPFIENRILALDRAIGYFSSENLMKTLSLKDYLDLHRNEMAKNISNYYDLRQSYLTPEDDAPKGKGAKRARIDNKDQGNYSTSFVEPIELDEYNKENMEAKRAARIEKAEPGKGYNAGNYVSIEEKIDKIRNENDPPSDARVHFPANSVLIKQLRALQKINDVPNTEALESYVGKLGKENIASPNKKAKTR